MENKLYTFITFLLLSSVLSAHAQDSTKCNARFSTLQYAGSNIVYFRAVDSVPSARHSWNFGDTTASLSGAGYSVSHTYGHPGNYTVTHVVRDTVKDCSDSSVQVIPVNLTPTCSLYIIVTPDSNAYNIYDLYVGSPSEGSDGADTITWFDNDAFIGNGFTLLRHQFSDGVHTIRGELVTPQGCHASMTIQIKVMPACQPPVSFTTQADPGNPQLIHFTPVPATDDSAVYNWNFGGFGSSSAHTPSFQFPYAGTYYITLTITRRYGSDSCRSAFSQTIYVNALPDTCHLSVNIGQNPTNNAQVTFGISGGPTTDSVEWHIRNPLDSTHVLNLFGNPVTHTFSSDSACYIVSATVVARTCNGTTNNAVFCVRGDSTTTTNNVTAYPNPSTNQAILELNLTTPNTIRIDIYNSMGTQIQTKIVAGYAGMNQVTIPTAALGKGIYYVRIQFGNTLRNSKIQKL
ncbi:MAG TPA: PKD domain-containing protein [Puia sp.]|nr:PKD domain-containing protein [Puia sp.]